MAVKCGDVPNIHNRFTVSEPMVALPPQPPANRRRIRLRGTRHAEAVWFSCCVSHAPPAASLPGRRDHRDIRRRAFTDWIVYCSGCAYPFGRDGSRLLPDARTAWILAAGEPR